MGTEKNSLYMKPVYIEKIDIKRIIYRPPKAMVMKSPSFCIDCIGVS